MKVRFIDESGKRLATIHRSSALARIQNVSNYQTVFECTCTVHDCYGNDIDIPDSYIQLIKPQLKCNSDRHKYMLFQITLY